MRVWGLARLAALFVALALGGCVTAENSLSQEDIASMKLTGVTVSFEPNARVQWDDGFRAYTAGRAIPNDEMAAAWARPEARTYVRTLLASEIKAGLEEAMAGQLNGARPVRLDIVVKEFNMSTVIESVMIGSNNHMIATANLVDARTGATILSNPDLQGFLPSKGGIIGTAVGLAMDHVFTKSPAERLIEQYGRAYRTWLIRSV
ncbi:hypothetical protein [Bradyrhizobium sp.]|uniref:hypothetical protein n=1 Tax=Bradyrhizobium sp. TaxID=376 RepID=UPI001ED67668|nr:hypothetical protein [Bradyrhizobium sp.]MBV9984073.1 hypothetical protein [Bradyrhizobium sp.]